MEPAIVNKAEPGEIKKESYYRDLTHELQYVSDISDQVMKQFE